MYRERFENEDFNPRLVVEVAKPAPKSTPSVPTP
jgi:hypothetical protein